ncbi:hypothetical protein DLD82_02475 [Methanospirillum stamsii]|uniref:Uncharacterized protein n=1 Tax=Methanospirillum stamsii TaxID=1277351 RepID=A0A2V2N7B5_9EURY|nr:hypothetical protein DLD82_02475 [Methanospirillum stamsii]
MQRESAPEYNNQEITAFSSPSSWSHTYSRETHNHPFNRKNVMRNRYTGSLFRIHQRFFYANMRECIMVCDQILQLVFIYFSDNQIRIRY